jgi:hypothetical protein
MLCYNFGVELALERCGDEARDVPATSENDSAGHLPNARAGRLEIIPCIVSMDVV